MYRIWEQVYIHPLLLCYGEIGPLSPFWLHLVVQHGSFCTRKWRNENKKRAALAERNQRDGLIMSCLK